MATEFKKRSDEKLVQEDLEMRTEMCRLYHLPDRFLGRALILISRKAREDAPELVTGPKKLASEFLLCWHSLIGLAARLGEQSFDPEERACLKSVTENNLAFRGSVGIHMMRQNFSKLGCEKNSRTLKLLGHDIAKGNPITIGLDRAIPPHPNSEDRVSRYMREASHEVFGDERYDCWFPNYEQTENVKRFHKAAKSRCLVVE